MIRSFRSKALKRLWEKADTSKVNPEHVRKINRQLHALNIAEDAAQMNIPGWRLHALQGAMAGHHSVTVNGNWRIVFRFNAGHACDVDYLDYH